MAIRIEPGLALVWRDPATLQLGLDPPRAVVPVPTTGQERFLCGLHEPVDRDDIAGRAAMAQCGPADAASVLGAASPALVDDTEAWTSRVEVLGQGDLADAVHGMLAAEGATVLRTAPPSGGRVTLPDPAPAFAVLVADHVADPVVRSAWTRRGVPHLPVVVGDGRVRIGPVAAAADGPCLQCLELHRVDDDPAWPTLAAQVWGRPAPALGAYRAGAIAVHVVRTVLARVRPADGAPLDDRQALVDRVDLTVERRPLPAHPACGCRVLPGTDSVTALRRASIHAVTT